MPPLILVVDDDPKITALLHRSLTYAGYRSVKAHSGSEALEQAVNLNPDLVILDLMLPDIDGFEVCRRLREDVNPLILMLTARDEVSDRVRGLDSGADDYLVKPFALEELLARVRALLRRRLPETGKVLEFADLRLDPNTREVTRGDRPIQLTGKEFDLLALFMANPRRVLPRQTIMDRIWGYDYSGESNVLEVYIGYLRAKLEAGGEKRLLHTVRGVGYVLRE
ncbi:MAG: response regulator transcription factor [Clostridia bacterium]|nr:response regulator transcription factor [Clostridia bacterium]MDH7573516.1 response regulator transcription factor [Clostridia bacterium]